MVTASLELTEDAARVYRLRFSPDDLVHHPFTRGATSLPKHLHLVLRLDLVEAEVNYTECDAPVFTSLESLPLYEQEVQQGSVRVMVSHRILW